MISKTTDNNSNSNLRSNYLKAASSASIVIRKITRILLLLINKRATVAEKAIKVELSYCATLESRLITSLTKSFIDMEKATFLSEDDCQKLRLTNFKLNKKLQKFLKAAVYNLNYLEQYFEHDFWLELNNDRFSHQLNVLVEKMPVNMR